MQQLFLIEIFPFHLSNWIRELDETGWDATDVNEKENMWFSCINNEKKKYIYFRMKTVQFLLFLILL